MQQAEPRVIQSPYSGEYIRPRVVSREDNDHKYEEAIYTCPSSGNFVKKVVLSTEPKKKVVNEALGPIAAIASRVNPVLGTLAMAPAAIRGASELLGMTKGGEEPCDPREGDPDCVPVAEDDDLLDDDQVLDSEQGNCFVSVLHGIQI